MTDYELEIYCEKHPSCDCKCLNCPAFVAHQRHELGFDEIDDEYME